MYTLQAPPKSVSLGKRAVNLGCVLLLLALIAIPIVSIFVFGYNPSTAAPATGSALEACQMAQQFVRDSLKAPSSADFAGCGDTETSVARQERLWVVRSYVDADNSFGAHIRTHFTAKVIYYPATDSWTLVDLQMP